MTNLTCSCSKDPVFVKELAQTCVPDVLGRMGIFLCKLPFVCNTFGISWKNPMQAAYLRCPAKCTGDDGNSESVLIWNAFILKDSHQ